MRAQLVRDLHNYDPRVTNKSEIGIPKFHIRCPNISPFTYDLDTIRNTCNVFVSVLPLPLSSLRLLFFDMPYHVWYFCHYLKIPSPPPLLLSDLPCQRWSLHHHYPHHHHDHDHCHGKGGGEQPGCFLGLDTAAVALLRLENSSSMSSIHLKFCPSITSIHVKVSYLPQVELAWQSWGHNTVVNPRMEGMAQMRVPASCCKG